LPGIRVLPDRVINLIAAGEVVERPSSVVKELIENSLDAGSTRITVELEQGGRKSITVRDDGTGMSRHDLLLSVQRHATSKITEENDLNSIGSLGFRGEALPSIAAVTHLTITTCDDEGAWCLKMDGGTLRDLSPASRTGGTTVRAEGLFYNQPARRRFLRSKSTELAWVEVYLTGCALARGDVGFSLVHNGRELFDLQPDQTVPERLMARYGLPGDSRYVLSEGEMGDTRAELVWFPDCRWNRRTHQYILVNDRLVSSGLLAGPLKSSLAGPAGYPLVYCGIRVPGEKVDVNVHPAKREVRFREPSQVRGALERALGKLSAERKESMTLSRDSSPAEEKRNGPSTFAATGQVSPDLFQKAVKLQAPAYGQSNSPAGGESGFPIVQIGKSYIVTSTDRGIVIIDQHAAHERILFETVLHSIRKDSETARQKLLLPEYVRLDMMEMDQIRSYQAVLTRSGFEFHFDGETLVLTAVPPGTFHGIEALREIMRSLQDPDSETMPLQEKVAAAAACAGAIKFGDPLSFEEARHLVDRLFTTSDPFHCPHGRPTLIEVTYDELDSKFGR